MQGVLSRCGRGLFALAVSGALGSGVGQAFAEPARPQPAARACEQSHCHYVCRTRGAATGECQGGECVCIFMT
jgi:hypothetical protein